MMVDDGAMIDPENQVVPGERDGWASLAELVDGGLMVAFWTDEDGDYYAAQMDTPDDETTAINAATIKVGDWWGGDNLPEALESLSGAQNKRWAESAAASSGGDETGATS